MKRRVKKFLKPLIQTINSCFLCFYQLIPGSSGKLTAKVSANKNYQLPLDYVAVDVSYIPTLYKLPFTEISADAPFILSSIKDAFDYSWFIQFDLSIEKIGEIIRFDGETGLNASISTCEIEPHYILVFPKRSGKKSITITLSGNLPLKPLTQHFDISLQ